MYLTLPLFALIVACGGGNEKKDDAGTATAAVVDLSSNPDYQKGPVVGEHSSDTGSNTCFGFVFLEEGNN